MDNMQLPNGFRVMENQVAGHTFQPNTNALGLLQDTDEGCVLKPLGKPDCGKRELCFYESLNNTKDPLLAKARMFVPKYHCKLKLIINNREHVFIKLEDLTHKLYKPCIMDIKIGKRTWDPIATPQKRIVEEEKYSKCKESLGLCLPGFQFYPLAGGGGELIRYGKEYGKQLDVNGFRDTIALFLNSKPVLFVPMVNEILRQLYSIREWFNSQTLLHFYASSLLLAYDMEQLQTSIARLAISNGNERTMEKQCTNGTTKGALDISKWVHVKMIDFAHVFPAEAGTIDTNYMFGLQSLIAVIEELIR